MRCSCCYSDEFRPSSFRKWESLLLLVLIRPVRCAVCDERTYRFVGSPALGAFFRRLDLRARLASAPAALADRMASFRGGSASRHPSAELRHPPIDDDILRLDDSQAQ